MCREKLSSYLARILTDSITHIFCAKCVIICLIYSQSSNHIHQICHYTQRNAFLADPRFVLVHARASFVYLPTESLPASLSSGFVYLPVARRNHAGISSALLRAYIDFNYRCILAQNFLSRKGRNSSEIMRE